MKKNAQLLALAVVLPLVGFYMAIGVLTVWFAPGPSSFAPKTSADAAAWVQAVASAVAIFASAWLALHVQARGIRLRRKGSAELALDIALLAKVTLTTVYEEFSSREKVYEIVEGRRPFDREALDELCDMVSELDLQAIQEPKLVRPLVLIRAGARKVRHTINSAFTFHRQLDADEFSKFFDILNTQAAIADEMHKQISIVARSS